MINYPKESTLAACSVYLARALCYVANSSHERLNIYQRKRLGHQFKTMGLDILVVVP